VCQISWKSEKNCRSSDLKKSLTTSTLDRQTQSPIHVPQKWYLCNLEYLVQLQVYCNEIYRLISLAIKRIHDLQPHLRYVSTLPDITHKPRRDKDELKQRRTDTCDHIPHGIIDEATDQWQTWLCECVKAKGRHFEHLLWSSHTTGSFHSHFRRIKTGSFQNHSHYWEDDSTTFRFLCNVR